MRGREFFLKTYFSSIKDGALMLLTCCAFLRREYSLTLDAPALIEFLDEQTGWKPLSAVDQRGPVSSSLQMTFDSVQSAGQTRVNVPK